MKWKILLIISALPLLGAEMEDRVGTLEEQMGEVGTETATGGYGAQFASGTFERGWIGAEFFGGVLYWHAKVGGTEYVYSLARGKGSLETQSFDWDFGYRIGMGIRLPIVKWEIVGAYTHFGTQDSEGRGVIPPSLLVNLKGGFLVSSQDVQSSYKIDYDAIVLELRRSSFLSRLFGLGSSLGVKQTWISQVQKVTYGEALLKVKDRCRFRGMGPQLGVNAKWHLFSGLSFFGDVKGAILYGHFEVKHSENQIAIKGDTHLFSPSLSFLLGLNWDYPLNWSQLSFSLAYEADYFWRQNQAVEIEDVTGSRFQLIRYADDLTFYGVTLRVGIEF